MESFRNKKVVLSPATPLTKKIASYLKECGIDVVGYLDSYKQGTDIFRPGEEGTPFFDAVFICNDVFFEEIHADLTKRYSREMVYRLVVVDGGYSLLDSRGIRKERYGRLVSKWRKSFYRFVQKSLNSLLDRFSFRRRCTVFIARNEAGANLGSFYRYLRQRRTGVFLISGEKKREEGKVYAYGSLLSHCIVPFCRYVFVDEVVYDYFDALSPAQKSVQLWHGVGLKRLYPVRDISYDYFVSTSEWCNRTNFQKVFQAKRFLNLGYPRNDLFFRKEDAESDNKIPTGLRRFVREHGTILYVPTYREADFRMPPLDFEAIDRLMEKLDFRFFVKFHPSVRTKIDMEKRFERVKFLESQEEIYPLMKHVDILVTDYSSILYDFLLLDRPIVAFVYDIEAYRGERGDFLYDYEAMTPAPMVGNCDELIHAISEIVLEGDRFAKRREEVRRRFFDYRDGKSCERITDFFYGGGNETV